MSADRTTVADGREWVVFEDEYARVEVLPRFCKDCGICVEACPTDIIESHDGAVRITEIATCTVCEQCELRCPDFAIRVTRKKRRPKKTSKTQSQE